MSKSVGNVVRPLDLLDRYGVDCFRYFLMRDMVVGQDSSFSEDALIGRINSDLANDLGNCLNRVERMIQNYCDGRVPTPSPLAKEDEEFIAEVSDLLQTAQDAMTDFRPHQAIEDSIKISRAANRYLEIKSPWKTFKTGGAESVATALWAAAEALRIAATLLFPVMPSKSGEMLYRLGMIESTDSLLDDSPPSDWLRWGVLAPGTEIRAGGPLFPRVEVETEA